MAILAKESLKVFEISKSLVIVTFFQVMVVGKSIC